MLIYTCLWGLRLPGYKLPNISRCIADIYYTPIGHGLGYYHSLLMVVLFLVEYLITLFLFGVYGFISLFIVMCSSSDLLPELIPVYFKLYDLMSVHVASIYTILLYAPFCIKVAALCSGACKKILDLIFITPQATRYTETFTRPLEKRLINIL